MTRSKAEINVTSGISLTSKYFGRKQNVQNVKDTI